eukprot:tig00021179_g19216.t1
MDRAAFVLFVLLASFASGSAQTAAYYNVALRGLPAAGGWRDAPASPACLALGLPPGVPAASALAAGDVLEVSWWRGDGDASAVDVELSVGGYTRPYVNLPSPGGRGALNCTLEFRLPAGYITVTVTSRNRGATGRSPEPRPYLRTPEYAVSVSASQSSVDVCASRGPAGFYSIALYADEALSGRAGAYPPFMVARAAPGPPFQAAGSPAGCPCGGATKPLALPASAPSGFYRAIAYATDAAGYGLVEFFDPSLPDPKSYYAESKLFFFEGFDFVPQPTPLPGDREPQQTPPLFPSNDTAPTEEGPVDGPATNGTTTTTTPAPAPAPTPTPANASAAAGRQEAGAAPKQAPRAEEERILWWQVALWALGGIILALLLGFALFVSLKKRKRRPAGVDKTVPVGTPVVELQEGTPAPAQPVAPAPPPPPAPAPPPPEPPLPSSVPSSEPPLPPRRAAILEETLPPAPAMYPILYSPPSWRPTGPTGFVYARIACPEWPSDVDEFLRWDLPARVAIASSSSGPGQGQGRRGRGGGPPPLEGVASVCSLASEALLTVPAGPKRLALEVAGCVVAWAAAEVQADQAQFCYVELKTISVGVSLGGTGGWRVPPGAPLEARLLARPRGDSGPFRPVQRPPEPGGKGAKRERRTLKKMLFGGRRKEAGEEEAGGTAASALEAGPAPRPFGPDWTPYDTVLGAATFDVPAETFFRSDLAAEFRVRARGTGSGGQRGHEGAALGPLALPGPPRPFSIAPLELPAPDAAALAARLPPPPPPQPGPAGAALEAPAPAAAPSAGPGPGPGAGPGPRVWDSDDEDAPPPVAGVVLGDVRIAMP